MKAPSPSPSRMLTCCRALLRDRDVCVSISIEVAYRQEKWKCTRGNRCGRRECAVSVAQPNTYRVVGGISDRQILNAVVVEISNFYRFGKGDRNR